MDYDFPVKLEGINTETGLSIPGKKAIVRTDTSEVLCLVSSNIKLKTHKSIVEDAEKLFLGFGHHDKTIFLDGANLTIRIAGTFKQSVAKLGDGTDIRMLILVEHSYNVIKPNPIVYIGGFVKKHNTWFINPNPVIVSNTRIAKSWEREFSKWSSWESCLLDYEKAVSMVKRGIPGVLNLDHTSYVIGQLRPNIEDKVSVWNVYYSIVRAISLERFSSNDTKLKKIKELHRYINIKFYVLT